MNEKTTVQSVQKSNRKRYLFYFIAAVCFGLFDSWYESYRYFFTAPIIRIFTYSNLFTWLIWLFLLIPVAIIEAKKTHNFKKTVLAGMLTWMTGILTYYLSIYLDITFVGHEFMMDFHISNFRAPFFWTNTFMMLISQLAQSIEWLIVAAVGGFIISAIIFFIIQKIDKQGSV